MSTNKSTKDANQKKIQNDIGKSKKIVCELINNSKGLFTVNILSQQLQYISNLSFNHCLKNELAPMNNWAKLFDPNKVQDKLKKCVQSIKLCDQENDSGY